MIRGLRFLEVTAWREEICVVYQNIVSKIIFSLHLRIKELLESVYHYYSPSTEALPGAIGVRRLAQVYNSVCIQPGIPSLSFYY